MIKIYVDFNLSEEQEAEALETEYQKLIAECETEINELNYPAPDTEWLFKGITSRDNPEEWAAAIAKENELLNEWIDGGSPEWMDATGRQADLEAELYRKREALFRKAEQRHFDELGGDPLITLADGKKQIDIYIEKRYAHYKENLSTLVSFSAIDIVALGGSRWKLDAGETRRILKKVLCLHIDALQPYNNLADQLHAYIEEVLKLSPYIAEEGTPGKGKQVTIRRRDKHGNVIPQDEEAQLEPFAYINTRYPPNSVRPLDKLTQRLFENAIPNGKPVPLAMEGRRKKTINTYVCINFEELGDDIKITGSADFTGYDQEVHNAIVSLYINGGSEYITPQMIYRAMVGDQDARLWENQAEAINNAITKFMYSRITIEAGEEAAAYKKGNFEKVNYDSNLIHAEKATAILNGEKVECYHLLRVPVLYEYAAQKKQIGKMAISLLNTPTNTTQENIAIKGYLAGRILHMNNNKTNDKVSKNILYSTVFNYIKIEASSDGALRKKKAKLRDQIKKFLDYWVEEKFIAGYIENKQGREFHSITIEP